MTFFEKLKKKFFLVIIGLQNAQDIEYRLKTANFSTKKSYFKVLLKKNLKKKFQPKNKKNGSLFSKNTVCVKF